MVHMKGYRGYQLIDNTTIKKIMVYMLVVIVAFINLIYCNQKFKKKTILFQYLWQFTGIIHT